MDTTEILNQIEHDKAVAFSEDKIMFEAVRKYVLSYLYRDGTLSPGTPAVPNRNWALGLAWDRNGMPRSNEELGADIRAITRGIQILESAFKELSELKPQEVQKEEPNPAV